MSKTSPKPERNLQLLIYATEHSFKETAKEFNVCESRVKELVKRECIKRFDAPEYLTPKMMIEIFSIKIKNRIK